MLVVYEIRYRQSVEKEEQKVVMKFLRLKGWGTKRIHEELMSTLGDDSYAVSQIKI
jgi:hypothetical protein